METMLVTQGLNELKTLDGRIMKAIRSGSFVTGAKNVDKNVTPGVSKEEYTESAKAAMQSISDLIARREKIKAAIVKSNAETMVDELGMTVAAAIETKKSIEYKKALLSVLQSQYRQATSTVNSKNMDVEAKITATISQLYGAGKKDSAPYTEADYEAVANPIKRNNEWTLIDPIKVQEKIEELSKEIEDFESKVDAALQISNCITSIVID